MNNLQQIKADKSLDTLVRYPEGVMTKRQWIDLMRNTGATTEQSTRPRIYFNRTKYNRMTGREQEEYERKCEERIPCYNLKPCNSTGYFEISKAEYDYFNSLPKTT